MHGHIFRAVKQPGWFAVAPDISQLPPEMEPWALDARYKMLDMFTEGQIQEIDKMVRERGFYLFRMPEQADAGR